MASSPADPTTSQSKRLGKRTGTRRERTGCLTCRQRKKKCDGLYPICDQCRRLNFVCRREDPRQPVELGEKSRVHAAAHQAQSCSSPSSSSHACVLIPRTPDLSAFWLENGHGGEQTAADRRVILRYYTQTFTTLITTTLENNCFLSVFMPMAMESPLFLDALLAWSSSHLALRIKAYEHIALQNRCTALKSLSDSLASSHRSTEMELASCLVHCAMESISGDTSEWFKHLVGAYEVIRSAATVDGTACFDLGCFATTYEGRWLLRNFAYHDILMTVVEDRKPFLIAGQYWAFGDETVADSYFGLASRIMYLISEISILNVDMAQHPPDDKHKNNYSERGRAIEQELKSWKCGPSEDIMLIYLAETYRSAALIHLYRTIRLRLPQFTVAIANKMSAQVVEIVKMFQEMPARCLPETSLLFPLFMAGGEAEKEDQIRVVRQRMLDMVQFRQFHNVEAALIVLEELWRVRANGALGSGNRRVDWKDVLQRRNWMLSVV